MKKWLVLPLLALLTSCVSYYQPESALEDGVYYPEDDPAYRYNADDFYYSRVVVYPWSSLDSFYFGYWPYSGYGFGYWPYAGYGFGYIYPGEPGFAVGYYGFYAPWYARGYATYYYPPLWRPYRYNCHHHGRCGEYGNSDGKARDKRYAGAGGQNDGYLGGGEENAFYSHDVRSKMGHTGYPTSKRNVSRPAAGSSAYRGSAAKSKAQAKATKNRARPVYSQARGPAQVEPSAPSAGVFSGRSDYDPSFSSPSPSRPSGLGSSSRRKDRD